MTRLPCAKNRIHGHHPTGYAENLKFLLCIPEKNRKPEYLSRKPSAFLSSWGFSGSLPFSGYRRGWWLKNLQLKNWSIIRWHQLAETTMRCISYETMRWCVDAGALSYVLTWRNMWTEFWDRLWYINRGWLWGWVLNLILTLEKCIIIMMLWKERTFNRAHHSYIGRNHQTAIKSHWRSLHPQER